MRFLPQRIVIQTRDDSTFEKRLRFRVSVTAPGIATIPLADFPDNFNRRDELDIAILGYANNLGLDPQDLQPLTGQALGTGAQSQVLNEKAKGKGQMHHTRCHQHTLFIYFSCRYLFRFLLGQGSIQI